MKKLITIAILLLPVLFACKKSSDSGSDVATSVVLSMDKVNLMVGETATITAAVLPTSLKMGVVWSVLDGTYAEVNDGTITAKAEGVTYVIATSADGYQKAACMVSVNPPVKYSVTILDEIGQPINGVYGYPGQSMILSAYTSDGEIHELTWSVEDESAGSITEDGVLTLGTVASAEDDYLFDVQSYIRVVTEDECGCRIPVRSSILNGIRINDEYHSGGSVISLESEHTYPIEFLYADANGEAAAIPAGAVNLDLSDTEDFSIQNVGGVYMLVTGSTDQVSSTLSLSPIGSLDKIDLVGFDIPKSYPIKASLGLNTSCSLTFTWTQGGSADDDVSKAYTIALYRDAQAEDLVVSHNIPSDHSCWSGLRPRFIFSGLEPDTDYWFRVLDTTDGEDIKSSDLIKARTLPFTRVDATKVSDAGEGDIILGEDFSEATGADEWDQAAGFVAANRTLNPASGVDPDGTFEKYTSTAYRLWGNGTTMTPGRRMAGGWGFFGNSAVYSRTGYLRVATTTGRTHIVTPKLKGIPEGKTATISVTITALLHETGNEVAVFVQSSGLTMNSTTDTKSASFCKYTGASLTNGYPIGIADMDTKKWHTVTIDIPGVTNSSQLIIGSQNNISAKNRFNIADITVTIKELN